MAFIAHVAQRTVGDDALTRSREIYGGIGIGNLIIEVPTLIPGTADIPLCLITRTTTCCGKARESVGCGHLETSGTRVVDGLDDGVVVEAGCSVIH